MCDDFNKKIAKTEQDLFKTKQDLQQIVPISREQNRKVFEIEEQFKKIQRNLRNVQSQMTTQEQKKEGLSLELD